MSTAPDRLLHRLEWRVLRRLDGQLQGAYRTANRGPGLDLIGLREYTETDDARYIDWNATARVGDPMVREFIADREVTAWLVLDRSASMDLGVAGRGKGDVLAELALVLARLFGRSGNRVGAVVFDGTSARIVPAGTGRRQALRIGHELGRATSGPPRTTDLAAMLEAVTVPARRRSLVVVISDFIGTGDWKRPLLRLAHRHDVVAIRVVDPGDDALPEVGLLVVEDAETGEQLIVDASDPLLRAGLSGAAAERDAAIATMLRGAAVPLHRVGTDQDLVQALIRMVASTGRRR